MNGTHLPEVLDRGIQLVPADPDLGPHLVPAVGGRVIRVVVMGLGRLWVATCQLVLVLSEHGGIVHYGAAVVPEGRPRIG